MNKRIIAVEAESRLGMKYIPIGGKELNLGVEDGARAVLTKDFLEKIKVENIIDFIFSLPENISNDKYYSVLANETEILSEQIKDNYIKNNSEFILTVGGDHSIASASLLAVTKIVDYKKIGVIMFDSHGDIHLKRTSPTGNYHGMWLRPFWDHYDEEVIQNIIHFSFEGSQLMFVGNVLLEEEEVNFLNKKEVMIFSSEKLDGINKINSQKEIIDFCKNHEYIHVSFDIDVFKQSLISATGTPNPNGFEKNMIFETINLVKNNSNIISLDLVEVNPKKEGAEQTIKLAQEVIEEFLK